jgi:hypothetical protein
MADQPSALALAAIQMAQHILEARHARQAADEAEPRRTMRLVKNERTGLGRMNAPERGGPA